METHNWITIFLASMRLGDTPVPIPNTTVKTQEADGTALETVWESRWMPDLRGCSSVGRAPALQAGGREFESLHLHSAGRTAETRTLKIAYMRNKSLKNAVLPGRDAFNGALT